MSTNRTLFSSSPKAAKKARRTIDLDAKMTIIKQHEGGKKVNVICKDWTDYKRRFPSIPWNLWWEKETNNSDKVHNVCEKIVSRSHQTMRCPSWWSGRPTAKHQHQWCQQPLSFCILPSFVCSHIINYVIVLYSVLIVWLEPDKHKNMERYDI